MENFDMIKYVPRNMIMGICEIIDGSIRLLSFGTIHTNLSFKYIAWYELKKLSS